MSRHTRQLIKLSFCLRLEQLVHFATPYSNYSSFRWRQEVHKPMVLVRLRSSEQQKWSCAPCLTGLWCAKLVILYCKWISMTPAAHDWPTPFSPRAISAALVKQQMKRCSPELNIGLSSQVQSVLLVLLICLHHIAAVLTHLPLKWVGDAATGLLEWALMFSWRERLPDSWHLGKIK